MQSSIAVAAAQRLLKRTCAHCKETVRAPQDVLERIQFAPLEGDPAPEFARGTGCGKCSDTGYKGRVAVIEAMSNYPEIQELILGRASGHQIKQAAVECGMRTLRQNGLAKAARGITTIDQVLDHTTAD